MNVTQLTDLYKSYVDEADETFLSAANVQRYLAIGYDRFRALVTRQEPYAYVNSVSFNPASNTYDLAGGPVRVLGSSPTATRMVRMLALTVIEAGTNRLLNMFTPVGSFEELAQWFPGDYVYFRQNTSLWFPTEQNQTLTLYYQPASTVDWTKSAAGDNQYIDDFADYHDLIALLAYGQYAIRDGAQNTVLREELKTRTQEFQAYLSNGLDLNSDRFLMVK